MLEKTLGIAIEPLFSQTELCLQGGTPDDDNSRPRMYAID